MAVVGVVAQRVQKSRRHAQAAAGIKFQRSGDAVLLGKFKLQRFAAQQIRILRQCFDRVRAERTVGRDRLLR